jgi:predicted AAA+ superfamily ATPase
MKLLSKTAEERYQTAAGVESDLRRCLSQWESDGFIDDFAPGTHDTPDRLMIPERLYGRDRDVETLLTAFDRIVAGGRPELVLVSGYSGIGKSAVVNELNSEKPDWRATAVTRRIESALVASQQPANWLASIPGGTMKLPEEHRRGPRRIAARVPLRKHV